MKLSVIIPVCNTSAYVGECVESVLSAVAEGPAGALEVICVDDGSVDSSVDTLRKAASSDAGRRAGMRVLVKGHAGVSAARNEAMRFASGDWVLFLDSDDVLARGWFDAVLETLRRHPDVDAAGFGSTATFPVFPVQPSGSEEVDVSREIPFGVFSRGMWQFVYRRDLLEGLSFRPFVRGEDKLFQGEALLKARKVALSGAVMHGYRRREGSAVRTRWTRESFSSEIDWRVVWLEALAASGKSMDRRLRRFTGLCLLEYIPAHLGDVAGAGLRGEMRRRWFGALEKSSRHAFPPWQRFVMKTVGSTRSRTAAFLLCTLPYRLKRILGRHRPVPSRRRILFCGAGFGRGGLSRSFLPLAEALERTGYEVKVLPPHASDAGKLGVPASMETDCAFAFGPCGLLCGRVLRFFHLLTGGVFRFVFARKVPHDAFVVFGASCSMEWCRYSRKPVWGFLHSSPMTGPSDALKPFIAADMRRSAARCRGMFAVSAAMKHEWGKLGIESETLRLPRPASRSGGAPVSGRKAGTCLFLGRLSYEKGPDRLLAAVSSVPSVRVVFVGDGPMRRALEEEASRLGVSSRVEFAGWKEDVSSCLSEAGVMVNASRSEGLSLSVLEALEAGVPVIATDIPGNREALADGRFGLLVENSVSGISKALGEYAVKGEMPFPPPEVKEELDEISRASLVRIAETRWAS